MAPPYSPFWSSDCDALTKRLIRPDSMCLVPAPLVPTGTLWYSVRIRATPELLDWRRKVDKKGVCISIDPGVRTFATCYDPDGLICKWGCPNRNAAGSRFWCVMRHLGNLHMRIKEAAPGSARFIQLCYTAGGLELKAERMLDEMHHCLAVWICKNYETVLLPELSAVQELKSRSDVLGRVMNIAHARFRTYLTEISREYRVNVRECSEAYTTQTCGLCGHITNVGASETYACKNPHCGVVFDRDENAARNILIKYIKLNDKRS